MKDEIAAYIDLHRGELLDLLFRLLRYPTVNPPGRNCAEAQQFVADYLARLGCRVESFEVYPGDPDVVGRLQGRDPGRGRSLILNGHIDVAEVGLPEAWSNPPFEPVVRDGRVYARGAADLKGGLAAALFALRALTELQVPLLGDVILQSVVGEESGEAGTTACLDRGYRADFALVVEPTELTVGGQGGVLTAWIVIQSPETLHDGLRRRVVHAGGGLFGAGAIEKMAKVIEGLAELERHWAVTKSYSGFEPGSNTINPAYIEGGRHPAFMADRCALWITVHFYPNESPEAVAQEVADHIQRIAQADPWLRHHPPKFIWGGRSMIVDRNEIFPPVPIDPTHPAIRALASAHRGVTGAEPMVGMWPSVSDAGWFASAGMPTAIYGPGSLAQAHTVDEWVEVEQVVTAAKVYALLAADWCNLPREGSDAPEPQP